MILRHTILIAFLLSTGGCFGWRNSTPNAVAPNSVFKSAGLQRVTLQEYAVDPPDEILLRSPDVKEYDNWKETVRPDGKVVVPFAGEISVVGKTPTQIVRMLAQAAHEHGYKDTPVVSIQVTPLSKFFYVFGFGAQKTGKIPYTGGVTVVSALAEAGFTITSWPEQVRVSRPGKDGQKNATAVVDFTKIWDFGDMSQNYLLEQGDVIFIPITPLAAWGEATRELLEPLTGTAGLALTATSVSHNGGI
jgi:polysaccharide export outer membrane protein